MGTRGRLEFMNNDHLQYCTLSSFPSSTVLL